MNRKVSAVVFVATVTVLGLAASARADNGITKIDQKIVTAAGGFPYIITAAGSYRLSGNLTVSTASTNAIDVNVSHVTLDLNGFSIIGPGGSSPGSGIVAAAGMTGTTVENGTVTGFHNGLQLQDNSIVKYMHADSNTNLGIFVTNNAVIQGCTANSNLNTGIEGNGDGDLISGNTTNNNRFGIGVNGLVGGLIIGNTALNNSDNGITANPGTSSGYRENVMAGNGTNVFGAVSMGNNICSGSPC